MAQSVGDPGGGFAIRV